MAGKSSKGGGFSKSSGGGSSFKSSSPSSQRGGGSKLGGLFSGAGFKSPARKIGPKGPKGGGFGSWRAPSAGSPLFGRSYGQSQGGGRGCIGCGCVVAIATLVSSLGGLAVVLLTVAV